MRRCPTTTGPMTAAAMLLTASGMAQTVPIADFDEFPDGTTPDGWTTIDDFEEWGGTRFTVEGGQLVIASNESLPALATLDIAAASPDFADDELFLHGSFAATVTLDNTYTTAFLTVRTELDPLAGYAFVMDATGEIDEMQILVCSTAGGVLGCPFLLASVETVWQVGVPYRIVVTADGETLSMKAWPIGEPEPDEPQLTAGLVAWYCDRPRLMVGVTNDTVLPDPGPLSARFDDLEFTVEPQEDIFDPPVSYEVGEGVDWPSFFGQRGIASGDLDLDGDTDLAVTNSGGFSLSVLRNNGDGTFQSELTETLSIAPRWVEIADMNGDGHLDLVTAGGFAALAGVVVLTNGGDGTFELHGLTEVFPGDHGVLVDVENDGDIDVITLFTGEFNLLRNQGDATFAATEVTPASVFGGGEPAAADFDGDGDVDLALVSQAGLFDDTLAIQTNDGAGRFVETATYFIENPSGIVAADVDADCDVDLLVANDDMFGNATAQVTVFHNLGDGTFVPADPVTILGFGRLEVGDLDRDGDFDLVCAETSRSYLLSDGAGDFETNYLCKLPNTQLSRSAAIADLDGDGNLDLAFTQIGVDQINVYLNNLPLACPPDTTGDGLVDVSDLVTVILEWGSCGGPGDVDDDGVVSVTDLLEVILGWGACQSG